MKTESLEALLIDREFGELPPETVELLEAWLTEHPEAVPTTGAVKQALLATGTAVRHFPELSCPSRANTIIALPRARFRATVPLALAASVLIFLGGAAWLGFLAGESSASKQITSSRLPTPGSALTSAHENGPWTRYALISGPKGLTLTPRE